MRHALCSSALCPSGVSPVLVSLVLIAASASFAQAPASDSGPCSPEGAEPAMIAAVDEDFDLLLDDGRRAALAGLEFPPASAGQMRTAARRRLVDWLVGRDVFIAAFAERPDRWDALYYRGVLLHRLGRLEEARDTLQRALEMSPLFEEGYTALGNVLMALDDAEGAADACRAAVRLDRQSAANHLNLATAYGKLGLTDLEAEAMAEYRRLVERR